MFVESERTNDEQAFSFVNKKEHDMFSLQSYQCQLFLLNIFSLKIDLSNLKTYVLVRLRDNSVDY